MGNERLKGELFRFIDVLPSLSDSGEIARHAHEYLTQPGVDLPGPMRFAVNAGRAVPWLTAAAARQAVRQMAHTFITAETPQQVLPKLRRHARTAPGVYGRPPWRNSGERAEAQHYLHRYIDLIELLGREVADWPQAPRSIRTRTARFHARMCRSRSRRSIRRSAPSISGRARAPPRPAVARLKARC